MAIPETSTFAASAVDAVDFARSERARSRARARWRAGWALTALPALFLAFDVTIKLANLEPVVESFTRLGYPAHIGPAIGWLELVCVALWLLPRTAVLGALVLTGYLGGAVATHVRVGDPLLTHALFPVYVAALLWAGLYLREDRLRALLPRRS